MSDLFNRMVGRATGGGKSALEPVLSSRYGRSGYGSGRLSISDRGAGSGSGGAGGEFGFDARGEVAGSSFEGADGAARGERPVSERQIDTEGESARRTAGPASWPDGFGNITVLDNSAGDPFEAGREKARVETTAGATTSLASLASTQPMPFSSGADSAARIRADYGEEIAAALRQASPSFRMQDVVAAEAAKRGESEFTKRGKGEGERTSFSPAVEGFPAIERAIEGRALARLEQNATQMKEAMEQRPAPREANEVTVSIGTIEVKLAPAVTAPTRKAAGPTLSLEDYLGQRNFGGHNLGRGNGSGR